MYTYTSSIHQVYNVAHSFLISWWKSLRASGCPTAKRGDLNLVTWVVFGIGEATGAELIPMACFIWKAKMFVPAIACALKLATA